MKDKLIKQDMNFLEYPLYALQERCLKKDINIINGDKIFRLNVGYKTPNSTDILFLYYFLHYSQMNNYKLKFTLSKYKIIKESTGTDATYYYKRLKDSLEVWKNIGITFENTFYDGKKYKSIFFGIFDDSRIEDDGKIYIKFNSTFMNIIKESNFYRYIDFNEFKKLRKPISRRIYEILKKSKLPLKIEIKKLAKKVPINEKYASKILEKLKPAINEINKNTDFKIELSHYKNDENQTICIINNINLFEDFHLFNSKQKSAFDKLYKLGLKESIIINIIKDYTIERIKRVYKYTLEQNPVNKVGFFRTALKENYEIYFENEKIQYKRTEFLKKEANKKYNTVCNYGNCGATWENYKDKTDHICHWCPKFVDRRNCQLSFDV